MFKNGDFLSQRWAQTIQPADIHTKSSRGNHVINVKRFPAPSSAQISATRPPATAAPMSSRLKQQWHAADHPIPHHP